jgi:nitrogen fixation NifU-like protein
MDTFTHSGSAGMYRENILDHYKKPRHKGLIKNPTIQHTERNPLCGDEITVMLILDTRGTITDIRFVGKGCAISIAAMSMLTEKIRGKSTHEVLTMNKDSILEMLNIPIGPARLKCALLGLTAVKKALVAYENKKGG